MREGKSNEIMPPLGTESADVVATGESLATSGQDPVPGIIDRLSGDDEAQILVASEDLARLGPLAAEAIPVLSKRLHDANQNIRKSATRALGQMGHLAIIPLTECLTHDDREVRRQAIWALGRMGSRAASAAAAICQALDDVDSRVAFGAAQALGNIGPDAECSVPSLIQALSGPNPIQCRLVAWALSEIGPIALPALLTKLDDPGFRVRQEVAAAIGYMGPAAKSAVTPILARLKRQCQNATNVETDSSKMHEQFKALGQSAESEITEETDDRASLIDALARIGPAACEAREYLTATIADPNRKVAQAAAQALLRVMGWN